MMEDWTDIIGEGLESFEEPLPADDWSVLQQKYAASRRGKRAAAFAWVGGIVAAVVLALMLVRPALPPTDDLVAVAPPTDDLAVVAPSTDELVVAPDSEVDVIPDLIGDHGDLLADGGAGTHDSDAAVIPDPIGDHDDLLADGGAGTHDSDAAVIPDQIGDLTDDMDAGGTGSDEHIPSDIPGTSWDFDDFSDLEDEKPKMKLNLARLKHPDAIGLSSSSMAFIVLGPTSPGFDIPADFFQDPDYGIPDTSFPPVDTDVEIPNDSLSVTGAAVSRVQPRTDNSYYDSYNNDLPMSYALSVRYFLSDKVAVTTGLTLTKYRSTRFRIYRNQKQQTDVQNIYYLGIPLTFDRMLKHSRYFDFYMNGGIQVDKCIYAKVGNERLYEKQFLLSLTGGFGMQINFSESVGLYGELGCFMDLNETTLESYRGIFPMTSARAGLRINL